MAEGKRKAAFIDRDGTINEDVGYLSRVEDLRIFPFTAEAIRQLKQSESLVIVVTNQSGIGRGYYDIDAMHAIHTKMNEELGGMIDAFYYCPHAPDAGCKCRKPSTGMIEQALTDFEIDMEGSWMIGDKAIDVLTGKNAVINTALVRTGYGAKDMTELSDQPDIVAEDLLKAVKQIISRAK